jgi:integrase
MSEKPLLASLHYKAVLTIAFNTGMRLGEIRQLRWSYIDWPKMMIRLPKEVTKEGRAKDVQFQEVCKKADIAYGRKTTGGIVFHDIRRTFKTNMLLAGVDKAHRDAILGHSLKGMDAHYIVVGDDSLTSAMDKYTKWLDGQLFSASVDQNVDPIVSNR